MANVLPQDRSSAISRFYGARFLFVGSVAAICCAAIACIALLPSFAVSRAEDVPDGATGALSAEDQQERVELAFAQRLVRQLLPVATTTAPGLSAIDDIVEMKPAGVAITNIAYAPGKEGAGSSLVVQGVGATREALNAYAARLRADARFKTVSVPLNVLAGARADEGGFTVTLMGDF